MISACTPIEVKSAIEQYFQLIFMILLMYNLLYRYAYMKNFIFVHIMFIKIIEVGYDESYPIGI
jgi:hypothetical protein